MPQPSRTKRPGGSSRRSWRSAARLKHGWSSPGGKSPSTRHDAFRSAVEAELARTKFFGRSFAVIVVRAAEQAKGQLSRWYPRVRTQLRSVDRAALHSPEAVEVLLPEVGDDQALALGRALVERRQGEPILVCGIASFPGAATLADEVIGMAWDAARRASPESPVQAASTERRPSFGSRGDASRADSPSRLVVESPAMSSVVEIAARDPDRIHERNRDGRAHCRRRTAISMPCARPADFALISISA
jgi:hypothetical protein